jgi:hypothetical protein
VVTPTGDGGDSDANAGFGAGGVALGSVSTDDFATALAVAPDGAAVLARGRRVGQVRGRSRRDGRSL